MNDLTVCSSGKLFTTNPDCVLKSMDFIGELIVVDSCNLANALAITHITMSPEDTSLKIKTIMIVRYVCEIGLKEAKETVDMAEAIMKIKGHEFFQWLDCQKIRYNQS